MTPDDIPDSPAGWHGPNYVHEIETPFILHDLRLFYIQAELFQWYDQMGLIDVALFDTNKEIVLNIYWGDSWGSQNKGYFHVKYYPEGGSPVADSTGYIYNNFWRMGELKVEDGYITYEISDHGGTIQEGDLGEVANPFRMVKYLVIRAQRYSAYDLNDMRLHAIGLYAGQDTSVEEPEEGDGTTDGALDTVDPPPEAQSFWNSIIETIGNLLFWWEGWWPRVHLYISLATIAGGLAILHMSVDLLFDLRWENSTLDTPLDDEMTSTQMNEWADHIETAFSASGPLEDAFKLSADIMRYALLVVCGLLLAPTPPMLDTYKYILMTCYLIAFGQWLYLMLIAASLGIISAGYFVGLASCWLSSMVEGLLVALGIAGVVYIAYRLGVNLAKNLLDWAGFKLKWGIIGVIFYFGVSAIMWMVWTYYLELSLAGYLGVSL
jgi:hypothetical protein